MPADTQQKHIWSSLLQDSLMPLAQYMQHALGSQHVVTSLVQKAAEANLSSATKARKQEQQKLLEVCLR